MAAIPTTYAPASQKEFDDFIAFADSTGSEWREQYSSSDGRVKVWDRKSEASSINIVRLVAILSEVEALVLYDVLHDPDYRKEWDDNMIEGTLIEQLDANNDVGYYSAKSPAALVSARDFVNQRSWRVKDDKEYLIMNHSVVHPKKPVDDKFVRANSIKTGYLVRVNPDGPGCILTYITQTDPRGWIPSSLMNTVTRTYAPKIVDKLNKAAKAYTAWKQNHNPERFPWRGLGSY
jgi:hypothetical protein